MKTEKIRWLLKKIDIKSLLISLAITFGGAILSVILTAGSFEIYAELEKPPFSPPGWVFPVVWTILYFLMSVAFYLVCITRVPEKAEALRLYIIQLVFNILWPVIFFRMEAFFVAFAWLLMLWYLIFGTIQKFAKINKTAGKLLVPYIVWVTFAGYLNLGVVINYIRG